MYYNKSNYRWDPLKNEWLKRTRGVSFEEITSCKLVAKDGHPRWAHQRLMLFERDGYIWVVPCVEQGGDCFLKTAFPSRKYTKKWLQGELG
jgi:hypothetical protein